jgi:hypothetical protein
MFEAWGTPGIGCFCFDRRPFHVSVEVEQIHPIIVSRWVRSIVCHHQRVGGHRNIDHVPMTAPPDLGATSGTLVSTGISALR